MEQMVNATNSNAPEQTGAVQDGALSAQLSQLVEQVVERKLAALRREAEERVAQARGEGRAEADRLASMSGDERARYEAERNREREEQLERREAELNRRELRARAADMFLERGLPRELGEIVDCTDEQSCAAGVDALEKLFREAVQRSVDERLNRGQPLPRSHGGPQAGLTRRMRAAAGLAEE